MEKDIPTSKKELKSKLQLKELLTGENRNLFEKSLLEASGRATVLVHPFFPQEEPRTDASLYSEYLSSLAPAISTTFDAATPLVILEEKEKIIELKGRLEATGITNGNGFVIPTKWATPEPVYGTLTLLSEQFAKQGLKEATVLGTMLWKNPEGSALYNGCAGRTIEIFTKAGIKTKPGSAVYPPL